jgi:hypothetical protein
MRFYMCSLKTFLVGVIFPLIFTFIGFLAFVFIVGGQDHFTYTNIKEALITGKII